MPHGSITPLGRQLRSVLAALRPTLLDPAPAKSRLDHARRTALTCQSRRESVRLLDCRSLSDVPRRYYTAAATLASECTLSKPNEPGFAATEEPRGGLRQEKREKPSSASLNDELSNLERHKVAIKKGIGKGKESQLDDQGRHFRRGRHKSETRLSQAFEVIAETSRPRLLRALARYVCQFENDPEFKQTYSTTPTLDDADWKYLINRGHGLADLEAWMAIVVERDSLKAATAIQHRVASQGLNSVPLPIISYVLLRPYVSARALRILCAVAWDHLAASHEALSRSHSADAIFNVSMRLARHSREVWPQSLDTIVDHMLRYLPETSQTTASDSINDAARLTLMLNKMMYLLSEPTAVAPFKDNQHQETALVRILAFMADATPNLQLNREGYRAVIRMQLSQKKTAKERKWADLKALSWPPWKEDRTRMDSEVLPEHGISRAGETLRRMQEAGYAPRRWEEVAKLYTGWDTDDTPTIQTRALLPSRIGETNSPTAIWEARIRTTRTAQEAWACYLAFEDTGLPHDPDVILAILEKLHSEEERQRRQEKPSIRGFEARRSTQDKLLPGDSRHVSPLPPSTHLYTYTRTPSPSLHEFFTLLQTNGTNLDARCLAFLVSNASSFPSATEYLKYGKSRYPAIEQLLSTKNGTNLTGLPIILLEAYVSLLTRFPHFPARKLAHAPPESTGVLTKSHGLSPENLNNRHGIVRAMLLLEARKPRSLVPWNTVLLALSSDRCFAKINLVKDHAPIVGKSQQPDLIVNGLMAYRLLQQTVDALLAQHIDLDMVGFHALCRATEKAAMTCWRALHDAPGLEIVAGTATRPAIVADAKELLTRQKPHWRLEQFFKLLVGDESCLDPARKPGTPPVRRIEQVPGLPRLLTNPGPAILHAYIRALGWCGAHENLLSTVKWMVEHKTELAESRAKDRNGEVMMRRAIVALRVFLERSWMDDPSELDTADSAANHQQKSLALQRLEAAASREIGDEVRMLVEQVEEWGGWPENEEVDEYCTDNRFEPFR